MTDKQQIEKFATDLCKACRKSLKTCECKTPCVKAEWVSEALYNAGYRKVEQDYAELLHEYERLADSHIKTMQLVREVCTKRDVLKKQLAEARKETAKEIIATVKSCMQDFEDDDDGYILKKCEFEFFMRELAKQLGVEVDE